MQSSIAQLRQYDGLQASGFDGGGGAYVQGPAFHKNGLIRDNQGNRYSAYVVMLPGGYTAVAASNSRLANIFTRRGS